MIFWREIIHLIFWDRRILVIKLYIVAPQPFLAKPWMISSRQCFQGRIDTVVTGKTSWSFRYVLNDGVEFFMFWPFRARFGQRVGLVAAQTATDTGCYRYSLRARFTSEGGSAKSRQVVCSAAQQRESAAFSLLVGFNCWFLSADSTVWRNILVITLIFPS